MTSIMDMTRPKKPKAPVMFAPDTESVLVRGLNAMTRACDALSEQNEILNRDIEGMKKKIARLQERVILNEGSKE